MNLESEIPMAVSLFEHFGGYYVQNDAGEWVKLVYYGPPLTAQLKSVQLYPEYPRVSAPEGFSFSMRSNATDKQGNLIYIQSGSSTEIDGIITPNTSGPKYMVTAQLTKEEQDGKRLCRYFLYDEKSGGAVGEVLSEEYVYAPEIKIGTTLENNPYALDDQYQGMIALVLPMSQMHEDDYALYVSIDRAYYKEYLAALEEYADGNFRFTYHNQLEREMNLRGTVTLLRALVTGFIALISLISAANVFNTISTNFALRRRDFGILRSMGMQTRQLYTMAAFECLNYGAKALGWSLPVGLILSYGIYYIIGFSLCHCIPLPLGYHALWLGLHPGGCLRHHALFHLQAEAGQPH